MKIFLLFLFAALLSSIPNHLWVAEKKAQIALLKINQYENRTVIRKSTIPGAGNGLFAAAKSKKGEVIGELGGRLLPADEYPQGNHYQICEPPYFIFVALQDIEPGTEIWSNYGAHYNYDASCKSQNARFFCGRMKIDCRQKYAYSH